MATYLLDLGAGDDTRTGRDDWANAVRTTAGLIGRVGAGDQVRIAKSPDPSNPSGVTGTFIDGVATVPLSDPLVAVIDNCDSPGWTVKPNVTLVQDGSILKEGTQAQQFQIAAAFTTGIVAFKALPAPMDLSAFDKVSCYMRASVAIPAGTLRIDLCSDAAGETPVNSLVIAHRIEAAVWYPVVVDNLAPLGDAIQSVALFAVSDPGTVNVWIDHLLGCGDLTLASLIGTGDGNWWPVMWIQGSTITLGQLTGRTAYRWYGPSGPYSLLVRNPVRPFSDAGAMVAINLNFSGTFGNNVQVSGGWNPATGLQDGMTFVDFVYQPSGFFALNGLYITLERLILARAENMLGGTATVGTVLRDCNFVDAFSYIFNPAIYYDLLVENCQFANSPQYGMVATWNGYGRHRWVNCRWHNMSNGFVHQDGWSELRNCEMMGGTYGIFASGIVYAKDCRFAYNTVDVAFNNNRISQITLDNCLLESPTEFSTGGATWWNLGPASWIKSHNHDRITGNHKQFLYSGTYVEPDSVERHTPSGLAWRFNQTNHQLGGIPIRWPFSPTPFQFPVRAGHSYRFWIWMHRSENYNSAFLPRLVLLGGRILGLDEDVAEPMAGPPDTWEQVEIEAGPFGEDGVVEAWVEGYGGQGTWRVDDIDYVEI